MGKYARGALAIVAPAALLRILLISQSYPVTNSDESTMGLMALHIANRGEHPIFYYGQNYMGSLEAYAAAALFHVLGPSTYTLRLGLVALFTLFLISMYLLTGLLYSKGLALVTLILLGLGTDGILKQELLAIGGYPETLLFGALVMLIASYLALSSGRSASQRYAWWRYVVFGCWGLVAGLGLWSDLLVIPFVLMSGLLLLVGCWREWRKWALPCLLLGLVIGALPLIFYNLNALPGQDSLSTLLRIRDTDKRYHLPAINQVTGVNPSCPVISGQHIGFAGPHPFRCLLEYAGWGIGFVLLWSIATLSAIAAVWKLRPGVQAQEWSYDERQTVMRHFARLALLGSAGLTMLFYAISSNAALYPQTNDRYLIGVLIAAPAVIWPLWTGTWTLARSTRILLLAKRMVLLLVGLVLLSGTLGILQVLSVDQNANRQEETLIHDLLHHHVMRIYSEYWTCDRISFQSNEQIICAVIDEDGHPDSVVNRYTPYVAIVQADPRAAFVLPTGSSLAAAFAQKIAYKGVQYQHLIFDGYQIYVPFPMS